MIRLFRKIRQSLVINNNFRKYSLYAIGEIFLVMVGILLALQVNNWNESRKLKNLEKKMLREVLVGLETDLTDIIWNLDEQSKYLKSQNIVIEWLESNNELNDSLQSHFSNVSNGTVFITNDGPYETLKQIGIRLISNDEIRDQILKVYDIEYQAYQEHNDIYKDLQIAFYKKNNEPHFKSTDRYGNMKPMNVLKIKTDSSYSYHVKTIRNWNIFLIESNIKWAKREVEKTVDMIANELQEK